jgi:hypothetical protein
MPLQQVFRLTAWSAVLTLCGAACTRTVPAKLQSPNAAQWSAWTSRKETSTPVRFYPILPYEALSQEDYKGITRPGDLPEEVRRALADLFHAPELDMAAAGEPFNDSCLVDPDLPASRLVVAAVGPRYAVVQFETGGYGPAVSTAVFQRSAGHAILLWCGQVWRSIGNPAEFVSEVRAGSYWKTVADMYPFQR